MADADGGDDGRGLNGRNRPVRVLVACDKFRGSMSAAEANGAILAALEASGLPATGEAVAIADGGEGTLEALAGPGTTVESATVPGPYGPRVTAPFLHDPERQRAVVELAAVAGHAVARTAGYRPHAASSFGVGALMRAALDAGVREVIVALGGSITTDAGAGALEAMGARYFDEAGRAVVRPAGRELARVARVDLSGLDPRARAVRVVVAADVANPLTGAEGAAAVFGPQKGVRADEVDAVDAALGRFDRVLADARGADPLASVPGAGAAGGMLVGLSAIAPTVVRDGFALVAEHHGLEERVAAATLVVTGEGSLDAQSLGGKGPVAVARMAMAAGVPAIAFAGRVAADGAALRAAGVLAAFAIGRGPASLEEALRQGPAALRETAGAAFALLAAARRFGSPALDLVESGSGETV